MSSDQNARLNAALEHATRGWPTLPLHSIAEARCSCGPEGCSRPGKHPRTPHGVKDATVDADIIRSWWAQWPDANVAIATGATSGIVVLDVDGTAGIESLHDLEAQHGVLLDGPRVRTGGGGLHIYLKHPGGTVRNRVRLMPGLDLRADGSYVVAPPSTHASGGTYEWMAPPSGELPPAPDWLLRAVGHGQDEQTQPAAAPTPPHGGAAGTTTPYGAAALRDAAERVRTAPVGTRNNTLFAQAAAIFELMAGREIERNEVCTTLYRAAEAAGLPADEIERTLSSAWDRGTAQPRCMPSNLSSGGSPPDPGGSEVPRWRRVIVPASEFGTGEEETLRWAVDELWPDEAWGMLSGWKGTKKSYFVTDLALALTSGQPFGGRSVYRSWKVLMVSEELTPAELRLRLDMLARSRGLDWTTLPLYLGASTGIRLDDEAWQLELRAAVAAYRPDFMIWDPFARMFSGDENSARDVRVVTGFLDELRREFGSRAIIVVHDRKSSKGKHGKTLPSEWSDAGRGSGDLLAWARTVVHIRHLGRDEGPYEVHVRHTNAPPPPPMRYNVAVDIPAGTAVLSLSGAPSPAAGKVPLLRKVVAVLRDAGISGLVMRGLRNATGRNTEDVMAVLDELRHRGVLGGIGAYGDPGTKYALVEPVDEDGRPASTGSSNEAGPAMGPDGTPTTARSGEPSEDSAGSGAESAMGPRVTAEGWDPNVGPDGTPVSQPAELSNDSAGSGVGPRETAVTGPSTAASGTPNARPYGGAREGPGPATVAVAQQPAASASDSDLPLDARTAALLAPFVRLWTWRVRLGLPPVPRPPAVVPLQGELS